MGKHSENWDIPKLFKSDTAVQVLSSTDCVASPHPLKCLYPFPLTHIMARFWGDGTSSLKSSPSHHLQPHTPSTRVCSGVGPGNLPDAIQRLMICAADHSAHSLFSNCSQECSTAGKIFFINPSWQHTWRASRPRVKCSCYKAQSPHRSLVNTAKCSRF